MQPAEVEAETSLLVEVGVYDPQPKAKDPQCDQPGARTMWKVERVFWVGPPKTAGFPLGVS